MRTSDNDFEVGDFVRLKSPKGFSPDHAQAELYKEYGRKVFLIQKVEEGGRGFRRLLYLQEKEGGTKLTGLSSSRFEKVSLGIPTEAQLLLF